MAEQIWGIHNDTLTHELVDEGSSASVGTGSAISHKSAAGARD